MKTLMKGNLTAAQRNYKHKFSKDVLIGMYGEYIAKEFLSRTDGVMEVEDKSDEPSYQKADVDLLLTFDSRPNDVLGFEVKLDRSLFPNLFFETKSVIQGDKVKSPGCLLVTEAHYLMYIYAGIDVGITVPLPQLRAWVVAQLKSGREFRKGPVYNDGYEGEGYLLPVKELYTGKSVIPNFKMFDLKTGNIVDYATYDKRRRDKIKEFGGDKYVNLGLSNDDEWIDINAQLFPNQHQLEMNLASDEERKAKSRSWLESLEKFNNKEIIWVNP